MNRILILPLLLLISITLSAQTPSPEKWTFTKENTGKDEVTLNFTVKLEPEWHIFSQFTDEGGPLPMVFKFIESDCYSRIRTVTEPEPHVEFDSLFMVNLKSFDKEVVFKQKVKVTRPNCEIKGTIEYQICKEACIFKESAFSFSFGGTDKK